MGQLSSHYARIDELDVTKKVDVEKVSLIRARWFRDDICEDIVAGIYDMSEPSTRELFINACALVKCYERVIGARNR